MYLAISISPQVLPSCPRSAALSAQLLPTTIMSAGLVVECPWTLTHATAMPSWVASASSRQQSATIVWLRRGSSEATSATQVSCVYCES